MLVKDFTPLEAFFRPILGIASHYLVVFRRLYPTSDVRVEFSHSLSLERTGDSSAEAGVNSDAG